MKFGVEFEDELEEAETNMDRIQALLAVSINIRGIQTKANCSSEFFGQEQPIKASPVFKLVKDKLIFLRVSKKSDFLNWGEEDFCL